MRLTARRYAAVIVAGVLLLSACGGEGAESPPAVSPSSEEVATETPGPEPSEWELVEHRSFEDRTGSPPPPPTQFEGYSTTDTPNLNSMLYRASDGDYRFVASAGALGYAQERWVRYEKPRRKLIGNWYCVDAGGALDMPEGTVECIANAWGLRVNLVTSDGSVEDLAEAGDALMKEWK